jgi:hypothetical protein
MLNLCGIVAAILKMVTARNFSMSGINLDGHHNTTKIQHCSISKVAFDFLYSPFFLWHMNLSTADLRNYWTEFRETWWSYRYMFLVGPKVFSSFKISLKSNNVEFVRYCGGHFENGNR